MSRFAVLLLSLTLKEAFMIFFEALLIGGTAQKMKISIKDFFRKCEKIHNILGFCWRCQRNLLKILFKSLITTNFIFCAVRMSK